ncbi:MAG: LON peptidase substrate-binding domain-containing protein [Spongiibacteraceae bacterium]|nr:LON peptidase substrate-binding domain-containing protein [Spongiibacteraceae bacterium]
MKELALFPLRNLLFPGARMGLQIFEPRYLDLVRDSLRHDRPFGVVPIRDGSEVVLPGADPMPRLAPLGTFARIVDWDAAASNLLLVTIEGEGKFRLLATEQQKNFLVRAEVEVLLPEPPLPLPPEADDLPSLLEQLLQHPLMARLQMQPASDGGLLANQLAQLLPLPRSVQLELLAEFDPARRLQRVLDLVQGSGG